MKIAIIGAGFAGLTLAKRLAEQHDVSVFEKARGPGGRMSTRRADPFAFDHGAQYFTVETERFEAFLSPYPRERTGTVNPDGLYQPVLSRQADTAGNHRQWGSPR